MSIIEQLHALRDYNGGKRHTVGLADAEISELAGKDERIAKVVAAATAAHKVFRWWGCDV